MKYLLTYCTMDSKIANPLHHAFIVVSKIANMGQKIEVKHAWGFNPTPVSNPNTYWSQFKKSLGFNFDLQGNYGILKIEEMRYLDLGYALHGITFEIDDAQYQKLKKMCKDFILEQDNAVNEAKQNLKHLGREPYLHEIFEEEKHLAELNGRKPRLRPFEIRASMTTSGLSLTESFNCKTMALELISAIGVPQKYLNSITQKNASPVLPIYSGEMEDIYFHSIGSLHEYQSERTGEITLFKKWDNSKLYWSLPPQYIAKSGENDKVEYSNHEYALPVDWVKEIKQTVSRLQQIEHVVVYADLEYQFESYRGLLLNKICQTYEKFTTMNAKTEYMEYHDNLSKANNFLTRMYHAIHDNSFEENYIETIASLLDDQSQEKVCNILELSFTRPVYLDESESDEISNPIVSLTRF